MQLFRTGSADPLELRVTGIAMWILTIFYFYITKQKRIVITIEQNNAHLKP